MKQYSIVLLSVLIVLSACSPQGTDVPETVVAVVAPTLAATSLPSSPFDYDATRPFDVKINSQTEKDGVTITDVSYASFDPSFSTALNGRTLAYLVTPQGDGSFAGVIYLHWFGNVNSSRKQYLDEAVEFAKHGVVSLLLQGNYPWMEGQTSDAADRPRIIGQITELRRAIDFLLTQPNVDPKRLGFVGHDYGAVFGSTLSGVDQRLKTYVLIAGVPTLKDFQTVGTTLPDGYVQLIEDIDPIRYVSKASPASLFFQFAKLDQFVSQNMANQLYNAASEPKKITWYDDNHQMANETARADRLAWLTEQLGLSLAP